jgi:hypothetical protein
MPTPVQVGQPLLKSYLDVDFSNLLDTQGEKPFKRIPESRGTLLFIDLLPNVPWPHPCLWVVMGHEEGSKVGFRPWKWPPCLEVEIEKEDDTHLQEGLDGLDMDPWPRQRRQSKKRPKELPFEEYPLTGTHCSACGEPQRMTDGGFSCKNGHGGAPPK